MKKYNYTSYQNYIEEQKSHQNTVDRTKNRNRAAYIQKIKQHFPSAKSILCVGSRHISEVLSFRNEGYQAIGIDLYSQDTDIIKIVDMHKIKESFCENEFDVIFSCHSLEHSYDPGSVIESFRYVSKQGAFIVLPLSKSPTAKDPCVFEFMEQVNSSPEIKNIENELKDISGCELSVREMVYMPSQFDGIWLSVNWSKFSL